MPFLGPHDTFPSAKRSPNAQNMSPLPSTHMELSPPSTPSQLWPSPLYTSSPSKSSSPMYPTFCKDDAGTEQLALQQRTARACHGLHMPMPTTSEVTIGRASVESVSLEQHLQHSGTLREEAMQSFIVERFLPAAKAVATDHDHGLHTPDKHPSIKPSTTPHTPMSNSTKNTARLYSIPSPSFASTGVTWSAPLSQDEGEMDSFDDEEPTKSSGFFCVGLKTVISRVHKVVHPSAFSTSRNKSRAAPSYNHETSYDEEGGVLPKVNVLSQGKQRRRNAHPTASDSFSSSFPSIESIQRGRSSRFTVSPRSSLPRSGGRGQDGSPFVIRASTDATPLYNMLESCHLTGPFRQQLECNCFKQSPMPDNAWRCSPRPSFDQFCANFHWQHTENPSGAIRSKDYCLQNTSRRTESDLSIQDPSDKVSLTEHHDAIEGTERCDAVEGELRDPDYTDDDENEFYDAFDSWSSIPGDVTPLTSMSPPKSPKVSGSSKKWTSNDNGVVDVPSNVEIPPVLRNITCKTSDFDGNHELHSKYFLEKLETPRLSCEEGASAYSACTAALKQKHGNTQLDLKKGSSCGTLNDTSALKSSSAPSIFRSDCRGSTPNGHKKCLSSPEPGWPLGISSVQSTTKKSCFQEQGRHNVRCVTNSVAAFMESNVSSPRVSSVQLTTKKSCFQEQGRHNDRCVTNSVAAFTESNVSSPRVPASPTGSWLERAMALNASKPSTLATLQQKEKAASARKKLEFTLSDTKKEVKWEDVVKGSQMHPEHFRFSEDLRHRHPHNRNAIKPLRL